ncbi:hypothetical protein HDU86_007332 [Geranomyces michiganensis]|nr:hypothetical protein HDU86_007332 [Geranomyces michiganensis]
MHPQDEDDGWEDAAPNDAYLQGLFCACAPTGLTLTADSLSPIDILARGPDELDPEGYDETDSEVTNPLYRVDLKGYLTQFLTNFARSDTALLRQLGDSDIQTLRKFVPSA